MTEKEQRTERIKTLQLAIDGSLDRVEGSTDEQYMKDQAIKRNAWQKELDELKRLNDIDPGDPRPSGKFEMLHEASAYNAIFIVEKRNDGLIRIDIKKNRFGRVRTKVFDQTDEALDFIRDLLTGN